MAISLGGSRAGARNARLGARPQARTGAVFDTALLGLCVVAAVVLLALPAELRDRTAAALRRTAVAPLVELQRIAEVQRAKYLSYDERVTQRAELARDAADVTGLRAENERLRRTLGLGARLQWGFVTAEAIPNQLASELARKQILLTFLLTQGGRAGITPFAPVVAPEGLVGMVEQVDPAMSMAITYAHPDFRVSAQTPEGTAFGIVQPHLGSGAARALLEMRGVPFRSSLKPGQLVVSSGQGGTYPRGIAVGTVIREIQTAERWARTYLLQPAVTLGDVGAVMVLRKPRVQAGVDSVWATVESADSAARRVAAAGDSLARDALLREAAARRAAMEAALADSAARDATGGADADDDTPGDVPPPAPAEPSTGAAPVVARPTVPRPSAPSGEASGPPRRPAAGPSAPAAAPRSEVRTSDSASARPAVPRPTVPVRPTVPRPAPATTNPSTTPAPSPDARGAAAATRDSAPGEVALRRAPVRRVGSATATEPRRVAAATPVQRSSVSRPRVTTAVATGSVKAAALPVAASAPRTAPTRAGDGISRRAPADSAARRTPTRLAEPEGARPRSVVAGRAADAAGPNRPPARASGPARSTVATAPASGSRAGGPPTPRPRSADAAPAAPRSSATTTRAGGAPKPSAREDQTAAARPRPTRAAPTTDGVSARGDRRPVRPTAPARPAAGSRPTTGGAA